MRMDLIIRPDYGASVPWVKRLPDDRLSAIAGPDMVLLRAPSSCVRKAIASSRIFQLRLEKW
jgi:hypothetical protein